MNLPLFEAGVDTSLLARAKSSQDSTCENVQQSSSVNKCLATAAVSVRLHRGRADV